MTNQHVPAASTFTTDVHLPMFPLLCPLLYLPFLEQQTRAKQELPETMNDFNNSNSQDTLHEYLLITAENPTDLHFNLQHKKALIQ